MSRVVPSLIVAAIERTYPWATKGQDAALGPDQAPNVGMILELLDAVPENLLPTNTESRVLLTAAVGAMRGVLQSWTSGGHPGYSSHLFAMPGLGNKHPVRVVLEVLRQCSDEPSAIGESGLEFVEDEEMRRQLRRDAASAHRALAHGDYKAATVLAGSVIEALLLDSISRVEDERRQAAVGAVIDSRRAGGSPVPDKRGLEHWYLADFGDVAERLGLIRPSTARSVRLSNEFRNLIHPGRAIRTGQSCSQATALTAVGGMEHVLEDLHADA